MLKELHIENIAVIPVADVSFSSGFTALTGETGAGKSILIDAIHAVLGERTSKDIIRSGCDKAQITAVFYDLKDTTKSKLEDLGYDISEDTLIISRTILADGKSNARINGKPALASILKEISPTLVNIHGQHDSQALLYQENHYGFVDLIADNEKVLSEYKSAFVNMQKVRKQLKDAIDYAEKISDKEEILRYQVDELSKAELKVGELENLKSKRDIMRNSEKIASLLLKTKQLLSGYDDFDGAISYCDTAVNNLSQIEKITSEYNKIRERLADASVLLSDIGDEIASVSDSLSFSQKELDEIENRVDFIQSICKKYGGDEASALEFLDKAKEQLSTIDNSDDILKGKQEELLLWVEKVKTLGKKVTHSRKSAAEKFSKQVEEQLEFLNMPNVKFSVSVDESKYSQNGADRVEFMISTSPSEPLKPIIKIASGGELSRIMLAIKNVLSEKDDVDTLIFDEIDTGISGNAAHKVGLKLRETAKGKQVICVTHLAQIAALAQNHLLIEKSVDEKHATTTIKELDFDNRKQEIARIMSSHATESTLRSAEEMLLSVDKDSLL